MGYIAMSFADLSARLDRGALLDGTADAFYARHSSLADAKTFAPSGRRPATPGWHGQGPMAARDAAMPS